MASDSTFREDLFRRFQSWVFKFFVRRGFSREDAEELAQDVFVRVFANMDDLRSEQAATVWIQRITTSIWKNELRRRRAAKRDVSTISLESSAEEPTLEIEDSATQPADLSLLAREDEETICREVGALPEKMRRCLEGYEIRGLKYREIAEEQGISIDTVKSHIFQARRKLRERLAERWGDHR